MRDAFKKYWHYLALALIIILALFARLYHFSDWLHFGMDQARDAFLVSDAAAGGAIHLPLLGPRAAGTFVRLGPIFYYFQYLAAKITGSIAPPVFAYPDLLFSILTIPLFYFFLKIYFKNLASLLVTAAFAFNFVIIQYSRFAWNPNSIPFWTLFTFYSLLMAGREENRKRRMMWLAATAIGWAVASQLHFLVFAGLPVIIIAYLFWTGEFRKVKIKEIILVAAILLIFFAPMILNGVKTGGDNARQFVWAIKNKPQSHSLWDNIKADIQMHANYYTAILVTYMSPTGKGSLLAGLLLVICGGTIAIFNFRKEKDKARKNFLKLMFLWAVVSFGILIPFAFQIKPRFLFFGIFIPFALVGFGVEWLLAEKKYKYIAGSAAVLSVLVVVALNTEATWAWFSSLKNNTEMKVAGNRGLVVAYPKDAPLSETKEMAGFIEAKWRENPTKFYFWGNLEHRSPLMYLLETENKDFVYSFISYGSHDRSARYFAITTIKKGYNAMPSHYRAKFDLVSSQPFKKIMLLELSLKEIQPKKSEEEGLKEKKPQENSGTMKNERKKGLKKSERMEWGDVF